MSLRILFNRPAWHLRFILGVVATSGFCSLIYQVIWDRALRYNFGGDTISAAIVVGTFLIGLGIGAFIFGRVRFYPFRIYALVEAGIGLYGIFSYALISNISLILAAFLHYSIADIEGLRSITILGCILALLPPTILMGGTLPLMFYCFIQPGSYPPQRVGSIYGWNTLGASAGIVIAPYILLNHIAMPTALIGVGAINLILAAGIFAYGQIVPRPIPAAAPARFAIPCWLMTLSFIVGFITIAIETSLFRSFSANNPSSPYNFPLVLFLYLCGLALAGIVFTRFRSYSDRGSLQRVGQMLLIGMVALLLQVWLSLYMPNMQNVPVQDRTGYSDYLLAAPLIILVPLALGAIFPLVLRLAVADSRGLPLATGKLYLINSIGAFLGATWLQFIGAPILGTRGSLLALYFLGIGTGFYCLWRTIGSGLPRAWLRHVARYAIAATLVAVPFAVPASAWQRYTFGTLWPDTDAVEGITGVATVEWGSGAVPLYNPDLWLKAVIRINGQLMGLFPDHPKHIRLAGIAISHVPRDSLLVLGLGSGAMVRELAKDPAIQRIDVVDWSHELPILLNGRRERLVLENVLQTPKVRIYDADARIAVSVYPSGIFDVIIDNLTVLGWAGSTGLKSVQYFREISRLLKPDGIYVFDANWEPGSRPAVLAALHIAFKDVMEYRCANLVVAANQPIVFNPEMEERAFAPRQDLIARFQPNCNAFSAGLSPLDQKDVVNVQPVIDEHLGYEYTRDPIGQLIQAPLVFLRRVADHFAR